MSRPDICRSAAGRLRSARPTSARALIGMDGFVDSIIDIVDKRESFEGYSRMETIDILGRKITAAAGKSANYEFVVKQRRLGGNGPIFANALAVAGVDVDYIGSLGEDKPDPVFADFGKRARLHTLCEPGYTDALEFADGKLMLGKITQLAQVNWENILKKIGGDRFAAMCDKADLIAMNNWTMLPLLGDIWHHVLVDVLPRLSQRERRRRIFIDLADPEKRTAQDLRRGLQTLSGMQNYAFVMLGLNLKEAAQVANVLGLHPAADENDQILRSAQRIRETLGLGAVIIHPRRGAGAAIAGQSAWFDGPLVKQPRLSTGAGDNFNAGFCLGQLAGCSLEESLCVGCGASGYYVRQAASPTETALAGFVETMPAPES